MKGGKVLDTWALLAFLQGRGRAATEVEKIIAGGLRAKSRRIFLQSVNLTEACATIEKTAGWPVAAEAAELIDQLPIEIVGTENRELCRQAASHIATYRLTLGAGFAAALAYVKKAQLVTGDPQFLDLRHDMTLHWLGDPALVAENAES